MVSASVPKSHINSPPNTNDATIAGFMITLNSRRSMILKVSEASEPGVCCV